MSKKMIRVQMNVPLPDGTQGTGWAKVSPDIQPETLAALQELMTRAVAEHLRQEKRKLKP